MVIDILMEDMIVIDVLNARYDRHRYTEWRI